MSRLLRIVCLLALCALVVSCPLPQTPSVKAPATGPAAAGPAAPTAPALMTDSARNQVVYMDGTGRAIDIVSQEADGTTVAATQAVGLAVLPDQDSGVGSKGLGGGSASSGGGGEQLRAIVVGTRSDGLGGIWAVLKSGVVLPAGQESGSGNRSCMPESDDHDNGLHSWLGWTYSVTAISSDGMMIVGTATNVKGFHSGGITIDPNTSVGVYWRVTRISHRPYVSISAARVIGTLGTTPPPAHHGWWKWFSSLLVSRLQHLQLFFLNYFTTYLTSATAVSYDAVNNVYVVTGVDQDGSDATATISSKNAIVITPTAPPSSLPDLVVSSVQVPPSPQATTAAWTLAATVANNGTGDAASFTLLYQVSTKSTLDSSATTIAMHTISGLAAGVSITDTWSATIAQGGTHWIFVTANSTNTVTESNTANNTASASVAIIYPRLVIETYDPTNGSAFTAPFISLFDLHGDTTADTNPNEWNNDIDPYTMDKGVAIAESGTSGSWVSIDYQDGLAPGTYYVRIRGAQTYQQGAYAVRFLALNPGDPLPAYTYPGVKNTTDSPYEPDDAVSGGVPTNPVAASPGSMFNRYLQVPGDMDWFKLTLP